MPKHSHGGRRANQTGRPRHDNPKTVQVKTRFTPEEITCIDKQRQPNESRAACVRRLVMGIMKNKEQIMDRQIVVNKEVLEELIQTYTTLRYLYMEDAGGKMTNEEIEVEDEAIKAEILSFRERLLKFE
jgi:hypothetical protein